MVGQSGLVRGGKLGGTPFGILSGFPAVTQLVVFPTWDDMEVDVGYGLAGDGALVEQHVEAFGLRHFKYGAAEKRKHRSHLSATLRRNIGQSGVMLKGYDQQVTVCERTDVQEGENRIVLVDHGCGDFGGNDLAKYTIRIARHDSTIQNRLEHEAQPR